MKKIKMRRPPISIMKAVLNSDGEALSSVFQKAILSIETILLEMA